MAVIAFHSLEDREVKHTFRALAARRLRAPHQEAGAPGPGGGSAEPALAQRAPARHPRARRRREARTSTPSSSSPRPSTTPRSCARSIPAPAATSGGCSRWWPSWSAASSSTPGPTCRSARWTSRACSMSREREQLIEENRKLRLEKASLQNLRRVEQIAVRDLGLRTPAAGDAGGGGAARARAGRRAPRRRRLARSARRQRRGGGQLTVAPPAHDRRTRAPRPTSAACACA